MCECLEYEDGEMHLCVVCADEWREFRKGIENVAAKATSAPNPPAIPESSPAPEGCGICLPGLCNCPSGRVATATDLPPAPLPVGVAEALVVFREACDAVSKWKGTGADPGQVFDRMTVARSALFARMDESLDAAKGGPDAR